MPVNALQHPTYSSETGVHAEPMYQLAPTTAAQIHLDKLYIYRGKDNGAPNVTELAIVLT
jgi:hypothetical protein